MPLFEEQNNPTQETKQTENCESGTQNSTKTNSENKSGIIATLGQLLPWAPLVYEQFTGQKIPQMSGTIAEMQLALVQIQSGMQTIVNNQQELAQRLVSLETNANSQLTNLTQQFQSLRLTHTKERKEIEYNPTKQITNEEY